MIFNNSFSISECSFMISIAFCMIPLLIISPIITKINVYLSIIDFFYARMDMIDLIMKIVSDSKHHI